MVYPSIVSTPRKHWLAHLILVGLSSAIGMLPAVGIAQVPAGESEPLTRSTLLAQTRSRPVLQIGSSGAAVTEVQGILKLLGYYTGAVDGLYEEGTLDAVIAFQEAAGLQADGIIGPATWRSLLPESQIASTGNPSLTSATTSTSAPPNSTNPANRPVTAPATPRPTTTTRPSQPATPEPNYVELPILRLGMRGPAIESLQKRLQAAGFLDGAADGIFGDETQAAVIEFQETHSLSADGVVGPATWNVLFQDI
jgi:peptidoglycan hydrolase-like protein with peptidoglycan-binding domain